MSIDQLVVNIAFYPKVTEKLAILNERRFIMSEKTNNEVKIISEGKNRLSIVFPEGTKFNCKNKIPKEEFIEFLRESEDDVVGQCVGGTQDGCIYLCGCQIWVLAD